MNDAIISYLEIEIKDIESQVKKSELRLQTIRQERKNRKKLGRSEPFLSPEDIEYKEAKEEIKKYEDLEKLQKDLEKKRQKYFEINEGNFFKLVRDSISCTYRAVKIINENEANAIELFKKAKEKFPDQKHPDFLFNLAKANIENGDILDGITYLYEYSKQVPNEDPALKDISNLFFINEDGLTGKFEDISFSVNGNYIDYELPSDLKHSFIPLSFKVPIDLQIQDKGKIPEIGPLTVDEYYFLSEIISEGSENFFEIKLPRKYITKYIDSFIPVLNEYDLFIEYPINLEILQLKNYLIERKNRLTKHLTTFNGPDYHDQSNEIVTIARVLVPKKMKELFIIEFSQFIERYVLPQKNFIDALIEKKEDLKSFIEQEEEKYKREGEMGQDFSFDTEILPDAQYYAELHRFLKNFKMGEKNPLEKEQDFEYAKAFNRYLDFFGGKYEKYKLSLQQAAAKQKLTNNKEKRKILINKISNIEVKGNIEIEWAYVEKTIKSDYKASYIAMRRSLEWLTSGHLSKLGIYSSLNKTLAEKMYALKNYLPSTLRQDMYDIKDYGNKAAHANTTKLLGHRDDHTSPKEVYKKYENILEYYCNKIGI